jgi:carbon starvation protein CstA
MVQVLYLQVVYFHFYLLPLPVVQFGFHALVSSGTTPKLVDNEVNIRMIGYGGMLMESFVGIMAMICATVLDPGVYFAINAPAAVLGTTVETAAEAVRNSRFCRYTRNVDFTGSRSG